MTVFIIRRLLQSAIVVMMMAVIVFFGVSVIGDPVEIVASVNADPKLDIVGDACEAHGSPFTLPANLLALAPVIM